MVGSLPKRLDARKRILVCDRLNALCVIIALKEWSGEQLSLSVLRRTALRRTYGYLSRVYKILDLVERAVICIVIVRLSLLFEAVISMNEV